MEVQVGERAALAGDVDQVVGAPQQAEVPLVVQHEQVGKRRRLGDVAAVDQKALVLAVLFTPQLQRAQGRPYLALGGAAILGCRLLLDVVISPAGTEYALAICGLPSGDDRIRSIATCNSSRSFG